MSLEEKLIHLQKQIDEYKPATKWEAANSRTLKRLIAKRNKLEKAIECGTTVKPKAARSVQPTFAINDNQVKRTGTGRATVGSTPPTEPRESTMDREPWIRERAIQLWVEAGKPNNRDMEFWLAAEREYCRHICLLGPGVCDYQIEVPTCGGRRQTLCMAPWKDCGNHASDSL